MLGLLGLPLGVFSPFAICTGIRSLRRIRSSNGDLTGEWSAMLGLAAGFVGFVAAGAGILYWFLAS